MPGWVFSSTYENTGNFNDDSLINRLYKAEEELRAIERVLALKQKELVAVENKIKELQQEYDAAVRNLNKLEAEMQLAETRLNRSGRLTSALVDERVRWEELMRV